MYRPSTHNRACMFNRSYFVYMTNGLYMGYGLPPSLISSFFLSCTAMPTRDGARQIPHDPYAKPCRCLACRRRWWTFPKAGYRCIAYYQSQPYACLARISTSSHSTSPIMHTFHHCNPKAPHRHRNSSKTSSGMFRTGRTGKRS